MSLYKFKFYDARSMEHDEQYVTYMPQLVNRVCPECGSHPMVAKVLYQVINGNQIHYQCPSCEKIFVPEEVSAFSKEDDMHVVEIKEATTVPLAVTDNGEVITPVTTPQPRRVRYTPEFLEKAAKAMRDTPLKRQNIHVHEDDMESTCPACGYMLYEEANMIFNYCPTCGQALSNNDFSEGGE